MGELDLTSLPSLLLPRAAFDFEDFNDEMP